MDFRGNYYAIILADLYYISAWTVTIALSALHLSTFVRSVKKVVVCAEQVSHSTRYGALLAKCGQNLGKCF
jgi:hypothetical protein